MPDIPAALRRQAVNDLLCSVLAGLARQIVVSSSRDDSHCVQTIRLPFPVFKSGQKNYRTGCFLE
jgi:hypothetical protein